MRYSGTIWLVNDEGDYLGVRDYKNRTQREKIITNWRLEYEGKEVIIQISPDIKNEFSYKKYKTKIERINGNKIIY